MASSFGSLQAAAGRTSTERASSLPTSGFGRFFHALTSSRLTRSRSNSDRHPGHFRWCHKTPLRHYAKARRHLSREEREETPPANDDARFQSGRHGQVGRNAESPSPAGRPIGCLAQDAGEAVGFLDLAGELGHVMQAFPEFLVVGLEDDGRIIGCDGFGQQLRGFVDFDHVLRAAVKRRLTPLQRYVSS